MIVYKHKILLNKVVDFYHLHLNNIKYIILFVGLFSLILIFASRIVRTVNQGMTTQSKIDKMNLELVKLETENKKLQYEKNFYASATEKEAKLREIGNKMKSDETIYIISMKDKLNKSIKDFNLEQNSAAEQKTITPPSPNWQKWLDKVFN